MSYDKYKFELKPLPYDYDALEPYIDTKTMELHHDRHLQTYVDNLNAALANYPLYQTWSLEKLITNINWLPEQIRTEVKNNAGGVYNHNLYFENMSPAPNEMPEGNLINAINKEFGDYENFKKQFKAAALSVFGSGWAYLVLDHHKKLKIVRTANQDTPLPMNMCPVMILDVWEHAYYLKHYNKRGDYIDDWFNVVNLEKAEENYNACMKK